VIGWDGAEMPLKEFSGRKTLMHSTWKNRLLCKTFSIVASLKTNTTDLKRFTSEMKYLDPAEQELLCDLLTKHTGDGTRYLECKALHRADKGC
jgi:hypothetical protein